MRKLITIYGVVFLWACTCFGRGIIVTGRVVDYLARPVANAEVAVVENSRDSETQLEDARVCGPIGRTDERGLFEINAEIENMRSVFVVVRKSDLALAWNKAPLMIESADTVNFNLVMEKPALFTGLIVDSSGQAAAQATVRVAPKTCYLSSLNQSPISLPKE